MLAKHHGSARKIERHVSTQPGTLYYCGLQRFDYIWGEIRRSPVFSATVAQRFLTAFPCAVSATKCFAAAFKSVPDDAAATMIALRRHHVDCAFEAVKSEHVAVAFNLECFVVVVSAVCTFRHRFSPVQFFEIRCILAGTTRTGHSACLKTRSATLPTRAC